MLNKNQKMVLKLSSEGKSPNEIVKILPEIRTVKGVREALKRGKSNLEQSIENIEFAINNNLLDNTQIEMLQKILK